MAADAQELPPAPAFSAQDLLTAPTQDWITNGGNLFNQRYSPLTQINRDNVKGAASAVAHAPGWLRRRPAVLRPGPAALL